MKYAVIAVLIEDTDDSYESVTLDADSVETLGSDLDYDAALALLASAKETTK